MESKICKRGHSYLKGKPCKTCNNLRNVKFNKVSAAKRKASSAKYYSNNAELVKNRGYVWAKANPEKRTKINTKYRSSRRKKDSDFKLKTNLRSRLTRLIRNKLKVGSVITDLGCSILELRKHLESKFQSGMTWTNYGDWHIDHIFPLSKANLSNRDEFLRVCHYTNLQPLWAVDNIRKSNK